MLEIVQISGHVQFPITLDPSSWIFDDRKIDIQDYFSDHFDVDTFLESQEDERAGAAMPRLAAGHRQYKKEDWLKGSFVMPAKIFIDNAEPEQDVTTVRLERNIQEPVVLAVDEVRGGVFAFSKDGRVIQEDGPLHFYYGDRPQSQTPIKGISGIIIE